jgi:methionyl-tRNA formyltransferase
MTERMDAGPVLRSKAADILKEDDAVSLGDRLSGLGADLLIEAVREIERGNLSGIPQNEEDATFAPLLKKEDGRINWNNSADSIRNLVRGCAGWPGTFTYFRGRLLKIKEAEIKEDDSPADIPASPGRIIAMIPEGLEISCGKGRLLIKRLQPESKREMTAEEFINGYKPLAGECFTGLL